MIMTLMREQILHLLFCLENNGLVSSLLMMVCSGEWCTIDTDVILISVRILMICWVKYVEREMDRMLSDNILWRRWLYAIGNCVVNLRNVWLCKDVGESAYINDILIDILKKN